VDLIVELDYSGMRGVSGFVKRVVAGNPLVVSIVLSKFFPEPDCAILEVLVQPEICNVRARITVPVGVLTACSSVQIEDGVNALLGTEVNHTVKVLETLFFQDTGI